jgi:hypothetical protein
MREAAVNVEDLPSDDHGVSVETSIADAAVSGAPTPSAAPTLQKPLVAAPQQKKPANGSTTKPAQSSTLVRKNPFGDEQ